MRSKKEALKKFFFKFFNDGRHLETERPQMGLAYDMREETRWFILLTGS